MRDQMTGEEGEKAAPDNAGPKCGSTNAWWMVTFRNHQAVKTR